MSVNSRIKNRFAIIGAGINGAAVAREITQRFPNASVTVFEKSNRIAAHQTGHNSGVVHAGLYYEPGSLKARLCQRGVHLLRDYALEKRIPYEECGKIVVALTESELDRLKSIYERAVANGVPDVELIRPERIQEIEPNATGILALHSPRTAITDFAAVARECIEDVRQAGGTIHLNTEVLNITNQSEGCVVTARHRNEAERIQSANFDYVISCAGLHSDRVAHMVGGGEYPRIVPFFGQYFQLAPQYRTILNGLVYPVPDPAYPFLGVHLTKRVDGEMLVGPNAFLSLGRENYTGWKIGFKDTAKILTSPSFWRFATHNMTAAARELRAVFSRKKFLAGAVQYVPALQGAQTQPLTRGIRAQAMNTDGGLVDDFLIEHKDRATLLRNAPSPGATSAMAIAEHIVDGVIEAHSL